MRHLAANIEAQCTSQSRHSSIVMTVITSTTDNIPTGFHLRPLMVHFIWTATGRLSALELIGSVPSVITVAAFTVFSLPMTARQRVQSGSEWCPDGLETLTVRQTSPATPQLCTLGELWPHPGGIWILPEALQHCGPGWYLLHVQAAEPVGPEPRRTCEPGEQEEVEIWLMLIMNDQIGNNMFEIRSLHLSL